MTRTNAIEPITCPVCGIVKKMDSRRIKFCSRKCASAARKDVFSIPIQACKYCFKPFQPRCVTRKYCSHYCKSKSQESWSRNPERDDTVLLMQSQSYSLADIMSATGLSRSRVYAVLNKRNKRSFIARPVSHKELEDWMNQFSFVRLSDEDPLSYRQRFEAYISGLAQDAIDSSDPTALAFLEAMVLPPQ